MMTGLILSGILAVSQVGLASSSNYLDGESKQNLTVFDYDNVPMIGSPEAPYIVTLLFDCSKTGKWVKTTDHD